MKKLSGTVVRTGDVIGKKVVDSEHDELGTIEEIVLDKLTGKARYAVLSFGGFLGIGDTLHTLPWEILDYCKEEDSFQINVSKDKLSASPGFDKDSWPDFADTTWSNSIRNYYGL